MDSKAVPDVLPAQEFSVDGIHWEPLPDGIAVKGSRYALVLDEIQPGDLVFSDESMKWQLDQAGVVRLTSIYEVVLTKDVSLRGNAKLQIATVRHRSEKSALQLSLRILMLYFLEGVMNFEKGVIDWKHGNATAVPN